MDLTLQEFAASVGTRDAVTVAGLGTRGGAVDGVRLCRAPAGIMRVDAAEMVVECGAATPVDEVLAALAEVGQTVSLPSGGTVGGALAAGRSSITRLGHGPLRDVLLQTHYVSAAGQITKAGGPTVKNVSGFDLCRLFVGSWGTLGFFGDVIMRTRPLPRSTAWFSTERDPFTLLAEMYRPVSVLWDGSTTWVRLDGERGDVDRAASTNGLVAADGPPHLPGAHRWSMPPGDLVDLVGSGEFVAEVGVGVVHHTIPQKRHEPDASIRALHDRIAARFDPTDRLNPGIDPLRRR